MTITPTEVSLTLITIIAVAVGLVVGWGVRTAPGRRSAKSAKGGSKGKDRPAAKAGPGDRKKAKQGAGRSEARETPAAKASRPALPPERRKYEAARRRFTKAVDKRIGREPVIGERLRQNRELVIGWYAQDGRVRGVRFQAKDPRTACKVCQGRHNKEYDLLKPDVVSQIMPPCHMDGRGQDECSCQITAVLAGEQGALAL